MNDINELVKDLILQVLEKDLEGELEENLVYSKYDYKNKSIDNRRNRYSSKNMHTSFGDVNIDIPRDRKGEFEPQPIQKHQNSLPQNIEEKIISMFRVTQKLKHSLKLGYCSSRNSVVLY